MPVPLTVTRESIQSGAKHTVKDVAIIIPTLDAASDWPDLIRGLRSQHIDPSQVFVVDSASSDNTAALARNAGYTVISIQRCEFDHGRTRQMAAGKIEFPILLFMTQDAVLTAPDSICKLVEAFDDPLVGCAYGRQLPRPTAGPIEKHARYFNYPEHSSIVTLRSRETVGMKAFFISNSFAAYRRDALLDVGGFPSDIIFGEDAYVAARMLLAGYKKVYVADATVVHSHDLSLREEAKRYFDIGVFHSRESWLLENFGHATGEGKRFVLSEIKMLLRTKPYLLPYCLLRTATKLVSYKLGRREAVLSSALKRRISMNRPYWSR
ncbi:glycosyltransferase family 2 protein [Terriglobus albidus]|uniref:glycosyltransferase family 2 protein n=1 Tax=Terriglobus albidus TaxID=1592106 RepID=UPI0021DFE257|nr:glycosyltransferase [Terriglobus albidus]